MSTTAVKTVVRDFTRVVDLAPAELSALLDLEA